MLLALLVACADTAPPVVATRVDCSEAPGVTWESWGHGFFRTWCDACHAPTAQIRNGAPGEVSFDSRADVERWRERIRTRVLVDQTMPVGGGLADEDRALLDVMLSCDF